MMKMISVDLIAELLVKQSKGRRIGLGELRTASDKFRNAAALIEGEIVRRVNSATYFEDLVDGPDGSAA